MIIQKNVFLKTGKVCQTNVFIFSLVLIRFVLHIFKIYICVMYIYWSKRKERLLEYIYLKELKAMVVKNSNNLVKD